MKIISRAILLGYFLMLTIYCSGQRKKTSNPVTNHKILFDRYLPEFKVDSCLFYLLKSIVSAHKKTYSTTKYFYSLTFGKGKKHNYLNISTDLWKNSINADYTGFFKIDHRIFLCRGDFETDTIFKKTTKNIKVKLEQIKDSSYQERFVIEPSLQGVFYDCEKDTIYFEVYSTGMEVRYSNMKIIIPNTKKKLIYPVIVSISSEINNTQDYDTSIIAILPLKQLYDCNNCKSAQLSKSELDKVDELLTSCIQKNNIDVDSNHFSQLHIDFSSYKRQYVPYINNKGEKEVWVNCFCNNYTKFDWKHHVFGVDDGGKCYFTVIINLTNKTYHDLDINGGG